MVRPTSLLDLPREIRDQIYNYLLISPTNFIEAIYPSHTPKSTPSKTSRKQRHKQSRTSIIPTTCTLSLSKPTPSSSLPSLSICRVNTQIHHETQHIFWQHNILFSNHPFRSTTHHPSLLKLLKVMGQSASRLITKIVILMPVLDTSMNLLPQIFRSLDSRARHGAFKTLELRWEGEAWDSFAGTSFAVYFQAGADEASYSLMDKYQKTMRELNNVGKYDVDVFFPPYVLEGGPDEWKHNHVHWLTERLAHNTCGKVFWGDVLVWHESRVVEGSYTAGLEVKS